MITQERKYENNEYGNCQVNKKISKGHMYGNKYNSEQGKCDKTNKYSFQIGQNIHLDKANKIYDELNHSCNPNCYVNVDNLGLISFKQININEELTINYCCTEENLAEPFNCKCNLDDCYGEIKGFKYLDRLQQKKLKKYLSPYLLLKYFKE